MEILEKGILEILEKGNFGNIGKKKFGIRKIGKGKFKKRDYWRELGKRILEGYIFRGKIRWLRNLRLSLGMMSIKSRRMKLLIIFCIQESFLKNK